MPDVASTVENELLSKDEISGKLKGHIARLPKEVGLTKFLATFVNDYGLLCDFSMIHDILEDMKGNGAIDIVRDPALTQNGKPRTFWEEKRDQTITIRRLRS
jgi:hypothetical protein